MDSHGGVVGAAGADGAMEDTMYTPNWAGVDARGRGPNGPVGSGLEGVVPGDR